MKKRTGFVSNSSSSSFVCNIKNNFIDNKSIYDLFMDQDLSKIFYASDKESHDEFIEELNTYILDPSEEVVCVIECDENGKLFVENVMEKTVINDNITMVSYQN